MREWCSIVGTKPKWWRIPFLPELWENSTSSILTIQLKRYWFKPYDFAYPAATIGTYFPSSVPILSNRPFSQSVTIFLTVSWRIASMDTVVSGWLPVYNDLPSENSPSAASKPLRDMWYSRSWRYMPFGKPPAKSTKKKFAISPPPNDVAALQVLVIEISFLQDRCKLNDSVRHVQK